MPPWPDATPYIYRSQQNTIVVCPHAGQVSTYLWAQRIVVVNAWFLGCVDASILELEERLHGDVHEGEGGDCDSVGACDVGGSRREPRCNRRIDPVRLPDRQAARVLLLKVVPGPVSSLVHVFI